MKTPIEVWPTRVFRGRAGYSAGHFAMLAGGAEDPLRVAERIAARSDSEAVRAETATRLAAGEDPTAVMDWQSRKLSEVSQARWMHLQVSFDAVIAALESAPQTPVMKALVRQAKTARKNNSHTQTITQEKP